MFFQPQGNDLAKGLLKFARGKPINDGVAAGWLMVHGANTYGEDKIGLEARIAWVQENEKRIITIADDPWSDLWWTEADKPWQFLAFCFEWAAFQAHGWGYVSSIPVSMDGSCNGLQHFSAMLRDPVGGKATNLTPSNEPADIYQEVADVVIQKLEHLTSALASEDEDLRADAIRAREWLDFGITRKTTKRSVMVVPYSGTRFSCKDYIKEYVEETVDDRLRLNPDYQPPWDMNNLWPPVLMLTGLVWNGMPAYLCCKLTTTRDSTGFGLRLGIRS
jgi:DNA-directed RNA polymerase